jgi:hypothetical protein
MATHQGFQFFPYSPPQRADRAIPNSHFPLSLLAVYEKNIPQQKPAPFWAFFLGFEGFGF